MTFNGNDAGLFKKEYLLTSSEHLTAAANFAADVTLRRKEPLLGKDNI
jgi:hypothetical protein